MVELRETDTARALLRQTHVFQSMRSDDPDRLLRLERLCNQTYFDIRSGTSQGALCNLSRVTLLIERP